ncbi:MAG: glycosyltransferase [Bacteroidota bacterium]
MRILILTPYYYPYINPRAFRWTQIAAQWVQEGHEVHVLCSRHSDWPSQHQHEGVVVHRVGYNSLKEVLYNTLRTQHRRGESSSGKSDGPGWLQRMVIWINRVAWKSIYWPDDAVLWIRPARRKAEALVKEVQPALLISTSLPFSSHLIGLAVKKKNPTLSWLVDIGDPFSLQPLHPLNNTRLYQQRNSKAEQLVLRHADRISVTNTGASELYASAFPETAHKLTVIPPLTRRYPFIKPFPRTESVFRLAYFGSFFPGLREPRDILHFFDQFLQAYPTWAKRIELLFFGDLFQDLRAQFNRYPRLKDQCTFMGLIDREAAFEQMQRCDFLLHLGNRTNFQLPSKCPDYLQAGRPILQFSHIAEDTSKAFFDGMEGWQEVFVRPNYEGQELAAVATFLEAYRNWEVPIAKRMASTEAYLPKAIGKAYLR